jgi:dTDP-4-amino-4,6-dideoxygalactose transaminase
MSEQPIPLVDLRAQHAEVAGEIGCGFARVFAESAYILGEEVGFFLEGFAAFSGVDHGVGMSNGTDAIELALRALEIGEGDEVLVLA